MTFAYQKNQRFFAKTADGLESLGVEELTQLGATDVKASYRGLYFSAEQAILYRINYCSRLCTRILAPLLTFDCHSDKYLYKTAKKLPWTELLALDKTFAVCATVSNSRIRHSQYAARRLKDAIVDQFRESCGARPDVDPREPDVWIDLAIHQNKATISLDTSGGSLHRRGYRQASVKAPMQETVAAAIIQLSGWNGERPLYDPMCGSGTILTEALMQCCQIPAGYLRKGFGFEHLLDFDGPLWKRIRQECNTTIHPLPAGLISGSDQSEAAVAAAQQNCLTLPGGKNIALHTRRFQEIDQLREHVIMCNPPYGQRLSNARETAALLKEFGNFLKTRCPGALAYIYLGHEDLFEEIPLSPSWKKPLKNGGLPGCLAKYKIRPQR